MKVTLIRPNIGRREHSLYVDEGRMEPLMLGILAGLTPPDIEVVMHDDRMETIPYDDPTDLVAITVETYTARRSYEISREYRKRGVPVILGGMHPTLLPDEASLNADAIMISDAEMCWSEVLDDAQQGRLKSVYRSHPACPPQFNRLPDRTIYNGKRYLPLTLIQFGRGCTFGCSYCAVSAYFEQTHCSRPVREVVREIEAQDRKLLFFVDDNLIADIPRAKELFRELIPLGIRWVSQASLDMTTDRELLDLMVKSGCLGHVIGFESLDTRNLLKVNKAPNVAWANDSYKEQIGILRDRGLQTWAAFTLGYDHDTVESIEATTEFAIANKFCFAAFNILMPYPHTRFYAELARQNRLLYDGRWWLHPEYRFNYAAFQPTLLTPDELTEACFRARSRFNSIPSLVSRALDFKTNMRNLLRFGIYMTYTPLFRKETFKKQGMRFGYR
jgi:radical SAM superfamily enzyme YgiQ (UPF0313 family)